MPCYPINDGTGRTGFVCTRGRRPAPCSVPGCGRPHTKLCDYPTKTKSGTCDAKLCDTHAVKQLDAIGEGERDSRDYCPPHAALAKQEASR